MGSSDKFFAEVEQDDKKLQIESSKQDNAGQIQVSQPSLDEYRQQIAAVRIRDLKTDISLKKIYGFAILFVLIGWCFFVYRISCENMKINPCNRLSDEVLITLFTTTTIHILALPWIVLKYLFYRR